MYINDDIPIIVKISEVFDKNIVIEDGKIVKFDDKVSGLLDFIQNSFVILDENTSVVTSVDQRDMLYRRLNWLFSKILIITIHDENNRHSNKIRLLMEKMMQRSLNSFMYWFKSFLDLLYNLLKTTVAHNLSNGPIEIDIPGHEIDGNLKFSKIIITTESQINNFVSFLFLVLTRCFDLFPASKNIQRDVSLEEIITQIFIHRKLECKTAVLLFCSSYFVNVHNLELIDISIKIFTFMSTIYENLDEYLEAGMFYAEYFIQIFLKGLHKYLEMFLKHFKKPPNLLDYETADMLIGALIRLIFFESKWIKKYSVPTLTHWLVEILDAILLTITFDERVIKYIDLIKPLSLKNSNILLALKYKIILELENAENFDQKVRHMSKTWSEIQTDLALKTNFLLNNQQLPCVEFLEQLQWIKDAIQLSFDVDFHFAKRHQTKHCLNYVCEYEGCKRLENTNQLFTFNDWDYDHIYLDFFDDLPSITHKLTLTVSKRNEFTADILTIIIKLFSLILQVPSTTLIKDEKRLIMLATVISPFIMSFDNMSKSAEFTKIQSFLNVKLRKLINEITVKATLNNLKRTSIDAVTLLKFNKLGKSFEWLNFNLMQLIFKKEEKVIKQFYASRFINLLMTNFETMSTFLLHYQNIRLNNTKLELEELKNILCLHDKNVVILRTISFEYFIYCSSCKPDVPVDHEDSKEIRRRAYITSKNACIVSADFIDKKEVKIQIHPNLFNDQELSFYIEFIKNIPACIKHSKTFMDFCQSEKFFDIIFKQEEKIFAQTDYHFEYIIKNIQESGLAEDVKTAFFDKLLNKLFDLTRLYSQKSDVIKCQFHLVNMISTYGMKVRSNVASNGNQLIPNDERISLKCMKLLIYFVVLKDSDVKGVAVNSMLRMLEYNGFVLHKIINWYKTNIIEHINKLCLVNSLNDPNPSAFLNTFINTLKHLSYTDILKFIKTNLSILITSIFVFCIQNNKMNYIFALIDQSGYDVRKAFEIASLTLYERIYILDDQRKTICLDYIEKDMGIMFKELFQANRRENLQFVLIKFNSNPLYVMDVIKAMGDENTNLTDDDNIANYISRDFLGQLNNFEKILNSADSEKALKKAVLLSLRDLIRFLGGRRISNLCFKIMSLLRSANTASKVLKEVSISVWKILIFNCDISTLGPFLSQILVALESYIKDFPAEVDEICIYLIFENASLLSMHVSDLFFIEKTSFDSAIKNAILNQIESQRVADGNDFDINLNLMIRHLKNEHADSNVKIYCLQYLEEFIKRNRRKFNNLIFGSAEMDVSVKYLLDVLISCSKSFHNRKLQIQTAKCFGELGALKPALNKQQYLSKKIPEDEMTIHSDGFALKLLKVYCTYYKDMKETRHMESMALAIQGILKERAVNEKHIIWKSLPAFTRELFRPLLTSTYVPRNVPTSNYETIFWNQAQTPTNWAFMLAGLLIESIDVEETQSLLLNLLPSMRENQEICTIMLPRIILHYLQLNLSKDYDEALFNEFDFIFRMVLDNTICADASKDELNYKFVASYDFTPIGRNQSLENQNKVLGVSIKTTKMIFEVWDFLTRYLQVTTNPDVIERITNLFSRFEKRKLAEVNYKCGEYERAMILFESYIKTLNEDQLENELPFLLNIYAKLKDPDLIEGIKALRVTEWSFSDKILISDITGNLEGTFSFIEMMMKESNFTQEQIQTIINCYIKSNQNSTALLVGDQLLQKLYEANKGHQYCDEIKAEALWKLSMFDEFEELLESEKISDRTNWNVVCGTIMTKFRQEDKMEFWNELESARIRVMHNFKICDSEEAVYHDNYSEIFHLHILSELEKFQIAFESIQTNVNLPNTLKVLKILIKELDSRKMVLQTSTPIIDTSLSVRRVMLLQLEKKLKKNFLDNEFLQIKKFIDEEVGKTWIESVKITCKQKMFAQAHAFIMEADIYKSQELFIEKAKYYWMRDEKASALRILQLNCTELEEYCKNSSKAADYNEKRSLLSRGRLNIARFNAEVKNVDFDTNKKLYKDALLEDSFDVQYTHNEEIYVLLADYMDRHYFSKCKNSNEHPAYDKLLEIMEAYGSSMKYGINYVLQSMPRFLQIWFDAMTSLERKSTSSKTKSREDEETELNINNYVKSIVKVLKPYYFYTAFSQLISRLCHPSYNVYVVLKMIIIKLIDEYPLESMWFIMPNASSKSEFRKKRTNEILNSFSKERVRFANFNGVMEKIMCLAQRSKVDAEFMDSFCKELEKLFKNVRILMPLQKHLQCVHAPSENSFMTVHSQVLICKIDKNVEIMRSLQQPKKITFHGSDGKQYPMLLKFKDDLRIDFRFMEFLKVINDYFNKDADASQRCLNVRTYSVIPWSEDMGIIEWVPNLATFKGVVNDQYKKSKIKIPGVAELKKLSELWLLKTTNKLQFFNDMKKKYPPILGKWYIEHFSNVQNYFSARTNYIRSVAVMSMVGYIMGLGDRHLENILFDIHSGEVVHVDFACVFNKGESLGYPETVPFRLTQTMIEAMGPLGIEGPFRKCCEVALQLMQKEKNTLVSYLRPFIYDPMILKKASADHRETIDSAAMINLENVDKKLKGVVKKYKGSSGIALSSEGQVKFIIEEATSDENLAIMWFHWNPYI